MGDTRAQPIKSIFHRIGVMLAAIPALVALGKVNSTNYGSLRETALIALVGCGGAYLLAVGIGRILASRVGNNDQISN